jgi:hypothetical protein
LLTTNVWQRPFSLPPIHRWEAATGRQLKGFVLPPGREVWVHPRLNADGKILAAQYYGDTVVHLCDAATGTLRFPTAGRVVPVEEPSKSQGPPTPASATLQTEVDFLEVHHRDREDLRRWLRTLQPQGFVPVAIAVQPGAEEPRFTAVAVKYSEPIRWQFCDDLEDEPATTWLLQMKALGYRPVVRTRYPAPLSREIQVSVWVGPRVLWGAWLGPEDFVTAKARYEWGFGLRPQALGFGGAAGTEKWSLLTGPSDGGRYELHFDLGRDDLAGLATQKRQRGWRLEHISSFTRAGKIRFAAVTVENGGVPLDWELHTSLTTAEYEAKLAELRRRGLRPAAVAPYQEQGEPRYTALWLRRLDAETSRKR